jgi:DNA (cytosine-5)-methyltransferase 1
MPSGAYYNEVDHYAAEWLRNLIFMGHIAPGDVDERSIEDVRPDDLRGYAQCHFFAGIGVWSLALRNAGWPDDRQVWTGSCPCQPFSAAGKGVGFDDERHLWPAFHHLIEECRPPVILGEQVASKDADPWVDLVHADVEGLGYAFGCVPFPSAGVGAPHIRDRNYWVAHADGLRQPRFGRGGKGRTTERREACGLGYASGTGLDERERERGFLGGAPGAVKGEAAVRAGIRLGGLANPSIERWAEERQDLGWGLVRDSAEGHTSGLVPSRSDDRPGPTNGLWRDADWLGCRDGKWRPVEPGTFPLADGATARVGRLRAYGNAINASAAEVFIRCVMESVS